MLSMLGFKPDSTPATMTEVLESTQIKKSTRNPPSTGQYWDYSTLSIKGVERFDKERNTILGVHLPYHGQYLTSDFRVAPSFGKATLWVKASFWPT